MVNRKIVSLSRQSLSLFIPEERLTQPECAAAQCIRSACSPNTLSNVCHSLIAGLNAVYPAPCSERGWS